MSTINTDARALPQRQLDGVSVTRALTEEASQMATELAVRTAKFGAEMSAQGKDPEQIPAVSHLDTFA